MLFILKGETPAKKNSRITLKSGVTIPSKRYTEWHKSAFFQLKEVEKPLIDYPVRIALYFTHGDLRRRDSDNGCSSVMDLLVDAGILKDDNWQIVREIVIHNDYLKNEPQVKICIDRWNDV